jgi:hypothetical protein
VGSPPVLPPCHLGWVTFGDEESTELVIPPASPPPLFYQAFRFPLDYTLCDGIIILRHPPNPSEYSHVQMHPAHFLGQFWF